MSTAATTPIQQAHTVHITVPGFAAYGEFHGSTVDCGADAELMARHPFDGSRLDAATLNSFWRDYTASGHGDAGGTTLGDIHWHLTAGPHALDPARTRVARYVPLDQMGQSDLRKALIAALVQGQTAIVFLAHASRGLAYNERGVDGHFVALGGVDTTLGYLVGNGDDVNALGGKGIIPTRWYGWESLANAAINGMIALEQVGEGSMAGIPQGWKDDGTTLTAPNGKQCVKGIRAYILAHSWDKDDVPIAEEYSTSAVEFFNPAVGAGTRQDFLRASLGWTAALGVFEIAVGRDLGALVGALRTAAARISDLEQQLQQQASKGSAADSAALDALAARIAARG